jgi:hypothetical protein
LKGSNATRAKRYLPTCKPYKPGDCLVFRPLNSAEIIEKNDGELHCVVLVAPSSGGHCSCNGNDNDSGEGGVIMQCGVRGTRLEEGINYPKVNRGSRKDGQ